MENAVLVYGAFALAASVLALFALLGRRKDRKSRNRAT
jgi:hypothetical protein